MPFVTSRACMNCPHAEADHRKIITSPPGPTQVQPPYRAHVQVDNACMGCDCPGFVSSHPARMPPAWLPAEVVDRFGYAMREEGITAEVAIRVRNRVLFGHPDGPDTNLNQRDVRIDIPLILADEDHEKFLRERLGKWTPPDVV